MEESGEVQCEENKALSEKNKKRRFKTPAQLQGLEDFYNEHKYPTESMKAELAEKLGLTEKQISGWFCHRRLKDKKIINGESNPNGRQEFSSGVIQDRGSGLKQDSCSSTKHGDYKLADLREVESRRFGHNDIPAAEINYEQRMPNGTEMDDTSSESNSALQGYYPLKRSPLDVETTQYCSPNGLIAQNRKRVGPSGYLKIKGQTENAAVTAVKRQLGRHYREDGPSLGIEFDPLPPGAFESPSKNADTDAYGAPEPIVSNSLDIGVTHKRPGFGTMRNQDKYAAPTDRTLHKSDPDSFPYRQPKQKSPYPNHGRAFPAQMSSFSMETYAAKETSDFDTSANHNIQRKHGLPGMESDSYGGKVTSESEEPMWHDYDNGIPMAGRRRELLDSKSVAVPFRQKDHMYKEDRVPPSRIMKGEELYAERRAVGEHPDSVRSKMRPTNELRAGKKAREEFVQQDYAIRPLSQEPPQWSRQIRGSTEMPSSFSEDETAETSSSVD